MVPVGQTALPVVVEIVISKGYGFQGQRIDPRVRIGISLIPTSRFHVDAILLDRLRAVVSAKRGKSVGGEVGGSLVDSVVCFEVWTGEARSQGSRTARRKRVKRAQREQLDGISHGGENE